MAESIFTVESPANPDANDATAYTLCTLFTTAVDGTVTHIRWRFPDTLPSGTVTGALLAWTSDAAGSLLDQADFSAPTAGAWNTAALPSPQAVTAGNWYYAAVRTPDRYVASGGFFNGSSVINGNLTAPADDTVTPRRNGRFNDFSAAPEYPNDQFNGGCYFVDVVFEASTAVTGTGSGVADGGGRASAATTRTATITALGAGGGRAVAATSKTSPDAAVGSAGGTSRATSARTAPGVGTAQGGGTGTSSVTRTAAVSGSGSGACTTAAGGGSAIRTTTARATGGGAALSATARTGVGRGIAHGGGRAAAAPPTSVVVPTLSPLFAVVTGIGECVRAELADTDAGAPTRLCPAVPGAIAWDDCECGQLAVTTERIYYSRSFPTESASDSNQDTCGLPYLVATIVVSLLRCAPNPDDMGNAPTCAQLLDAASTWYLDADAVRRGVGCCVQAMLGNDQIVAYALQNQIPVGPDGGCVGSETRLTVGLPNCVCPG